MPQKVLCVGLTCLDIIQFCKNYPLEDSDQRSLECRMQRGGNASNNCTVLSLLGSPCEYLGTISTKLFWEFIRRDFEKYDIDISACKIYHDYEFPFSTVIVNSKTGSRTIIHTNNGLPELKFEYFQNINKKKYSWIHFEGRNVSEVLKMVMCVNEYNECCDQPITVSLELEKKTELLDLASAVDIVFVGKDFSKNKNWYGMEITLKEMRKYVKPSCIIISTWGEEGAMASGPEGIFSAPAYPPTKVKDTLGAGDTFCAGVIHSISNGRNLKESLHFGCKVAGFKVSTYGYDELKNFVQ